MIGIIFLIMVRTNFFLRYFSTQTVRSRYKVKLLFTKSLNIGEIRHLVKIHFLFAINYCFAIIVLHASRSTKPVIVTATVTDVLVLLTHAYPQCNRFFFRQFYILAKKNEISFQHQLQAKVKASKQKEVFHKSKKIAYSA